jgi:hypothetical protein
MDNDNDNNGASKYRHWRFNFGSIATNQKYYSIQIYQHKLSITFHNKGIGVFPCRTDSNIASIPAESSCDESKLFEWVRYTKTVMPWYWQDMTCCC